jgi:hypothetical protein
MAENPSVESPGSAAGDPPSGRDTSQPAARPGTIVLDLPVTEQPLDRLGRYKLLQQIGEGGCGVVYMAEQLVTYQLHLHKCLE